MKLKDLKHEQIQRIHCKSEEEANGLLKYLEDNGYKWISGNKLCYENHYDSFGSDTVYILNHMNMNVSVSNAAFYNKFTEYSDLVINENSNNCSETSETSEYNLSPLDVINFFNITYSSEQLMKKYFGDSKYSYAFRVLMNDFTSEEILDRIKRYYEDEKRKLEAEEVEIKCVYQIQVCNSSIKDPILEQYGTLKEAKDAMAKLIAKYPTIQMSVFKVYKAER